MPLPPYPPWALTDDALEGVGKLLRHYHVAVSSFVNDRSDWAQDLSDPIGGEVICHNDVCLENVVFRGGEAVAFLDFDFAAPGRPIWDVAMTARMCVPIQPPEDPLAGQGSFDPFQPPRGTRACIRDGTCRVGKSGGRDRSNGKTSVKRSCNGTLTTSTRGSVDMVYQQASGTYRRAVWLRENKERLVQALRALL